MQSPTLSLATHDHENLYWNGGNYELNMSFDALRDKQWQRVLQAIWAHPLLHGPLENRYVPGTTAAETAISMPPPTATQTQHGRIRIAGDAVGCDVLATRSLFECVSVLVPLGMFAGITGSGVYVRRLNPQLGTLDQLFSEIALAVYDAVPFRLAVIGWERECQVIAELRSDAAQRDELVALGNFFAPDETLRLLNIHDETYPAPRPTLRWAAAKS